jgi:hypothetical protein
VVTTDHFITNCLMNLRSETQLLLVLFSFVLVLRMCGALKENITLILFVQRRVVTAGA